MNKLIPQINRHKELCYAMKNIKRCKESALGSQRKQKLVLLKWGTREGFPEAIVFRQRLKR